jgi:YHS domain-containing protein
MKNAGELLKIIVGAGVAMGVVVLAAAGFAQAKAEKVKPYSLQTCIVSGEKLGGEMGQPYAFTYEGQEIKLCCKSCLKDFNKEPAKYLKKLAQAEKAGNETAKSAAPAHGHSGHHM